MKVLLGLVAACFFTLVADRASAVVIVRDVGIVPNSTMVANCCYGSGTFFRPILSFAPFMAGTVGDEIVFNVDFGGARVRFIDTATTQQAVGFGFEDFGYDTILPQRVFSVVQFRFLDPAGAFLATEFLMAQESEGRGVAANINPVDISEGIFTFGGVQLRLLITEDPLAGQLGFSRSTVTPSLYETGYFAVQTQGSFEFIDAPSSVPAPGGAGIFVASG